MESKSPTKNRVNTGRGALLTAGIAAILASTCCLGQLLLLMLGISGAWIGNLTALEPYRPFFIGTAGIALFFAGRRIWRPAAACRPDELCAIPRFRYGYKLLFWIVAALLALALIFPFIAPWFY